MRREVVQMAELLRYEDARAGRQLVPLEVTIRTIAPVVAGEETLTLDGILAYATVIEATEGRGVPRDIPPFWIPLPLGLARVIDGLPLWQSTSFYPVGLESDVTHYHRRTGDNPYALAAMAPTLGDKRPRRQPSQVAGQYMDNRIPIRRLVADRWVATCQGDPEEIRRLFGLLRSAGKHAAMGYGRIAEVTVKPLGAAFSFTGGTHRPLRPIPLVDGKGSGFPSGWTPPYWRREIWRVCAPPVTAEERWRGSI